MLLSMLCGIDLEAHSCCWLQWSPGAAGAAAALKRFLGESLAGFTYNRAKTDRDSTSRLSPHIHLGELSVRQVYFAVRPCNHAPALLC